MDTTFKTRFQGRTIECKTLTNGQMIVAQMLNTSTSAEGAQKGLHRLFRIVESRVGPDEWEAIDDGMAMGTIDLPDIMALVRKMLEATAKANQGDSADEPDDTEG